MLSVNTSLDPVSGGGGSERTFQITRHILRSGVACTVLTTDIGLTETRLRDLSGAEVVALRCLVRRFYVPRLSIGQIRDAVARADVIHLMGHWSVLNALVYMFARLLHKPYVVCPVGGLVMYGRSLYLKKAYNLLFGYRLLRNAAYCIAVTRDEVQTLMQYGVSLERIELIPNGVSEDDYQHVEDSGFRSRIGVGANPFILFVGRLNSIKGPDLLVRAFCQGVKAGHLPEFHLVMLGPDEGLLAHLKQIIAESNLERRVHFVGYLGGEEKVRAYHAATLLVIPSRKEAMSLVVLEAGVCGTPVLITDQCGFDEIADIGGGKVVAADVASIARALRDMLHDPVALEQAGQRLQTFVREKFTWPIMIAKYLALYRRIVGENR